MSPLTRIFLALLAFCSSLARAQDTFTIPWFTLDGGGGPSAVAGEFALAGSSIGQLSVGDPDGGQAGEFDVTGGYLSLIATVPPAAIPPDPFATTLFDSLSAPFSGWQFADEKNWLASKICLGAQAYTLDSVTLLLNSFNLDEPSVVRLEIYGSDPVTGKPSVSTGLTMNLYEATNPLEFTLSNGSYQTPFTWTPNTPFMLSANTCYWAVLIVESGEVWRPSTWALPTGVAGTHGSVSSSDAGVTWGSVDDTSNRKMRVMGIAVPNPSLTPELAADGSTAIPGGTGNFTGFPCPPSLSGARLVFYGTGSGDQWGIYASTRGSAQPLAVIANLNTPIPNGTGRFLSFGTEAGIIIVSGNVLFHGRGSGTQQGLYLSARANPSDPIRIADTGMPVPGGIGNFAAFHHALGLSGSDAAFVGSDSRGLKGVYAVALMTPPQVGSPLRIADTATAIPGGAGNFTDFPSGPAVDGGEVAFIGNGSNGLQGLYTAALMTPPQVGSPIRIADTAMAIPDGVGNFTAFGSDLAHPVAPALSGDRLAFVGGGSGGQQGVYGASVAAGSPTYKAADTGTAIPAGSGNFTGFAAVGVSATDLAFLGHGSGGQTGIYDMTGGELLKVVAVGDRIAGKAIAGLSFARSGLWGDPISFQATFSDGSQGVYTVDVMPQTSPLWITAVERIGDDLRLSFTSVAGRTYAVQSSVDLVSDAWETLEGTVVSETSETVEITVAAPFTESERFYRVLELP